MTRASETRFEIRPARPGEAARLSALALRSKAHWGYDEAFMAACVEELSVTPEEITRLHAHALTIEAELVGFYTLEALEAPERVELGHLFVEPAWIGRGCGGALLEHARRTASGLGYRVMVIQGDPNAAAFYRAAGARRVGARPSDSVPGRTLPLFELALSDR